MRSYINPEIDTMVHHLDRLLLRTGRARSGSVNNVKPMLMHMISSIMHGPTPLRILGPAMSENIDILRHRVAQAHGADELRDIARDLKQYIMAASSFTQAHEMEERLHELESQMKSVAEGATAQESVDDTKAVTLESLKGKRLLFTVMPFHQDFSDVWSGGIQRAASGTGLTPIRIDMITKSSEITDDIVLALQMAEMVVVDVTQNNPNVMFEFGFALALKKPHVVISQATEFLSFDIKNVRTIIYRNTWQGIETLFKDLQKFIRGTVGDKPKRKARGTSGDGS